jgi:hypothetical protein
MYLLISLDHLPDCDTFTCLAGLSGIPFRSARSQVRAMCCGPLEFDRLTDMQCATFVEAMAHFQQVEYVSFPFANEQVKGKLMAAFWRNRSLIESEVLSECLDASDQARILAFNHCNHDLRSVTYAHTNAMKSDHSRGLGLLLPSLLFISIDSSSDTGQQNILNALLRSGDSIGPSAAGK